MRNKLVYCLIFLWLLPQNLIGLFIRVFFKTKKLEQRGYVTYYKLKNKWGSVSLGQFIFLNDYSEDSEFVKDHEFGHYLQGLRLSWLWLLVIALPSIIWASFFIGYRERNKVDYYSFYPEKWANALALKYNTRKNKRK